MTFLVILAKATGTMAMSLLLKSFFTNFSRWNDFEEIQSITVLFSGRQIQSWACLWISIRRAERKYRNRDCRWKTWKCSLEVSAEPNLWGWVYGESVNDAWTERGNVSIQRVRERPWDAKENIFATKYFKNFHIDSIFIVWNQNKSVYFET